MSLGKPRSRAGDNFRTTSRWPLVLGEAAGIVVVVGVLFAGSVVTTARQPALSLLGSHSVGDCRQCRVE
jgi:hypothetical protein